jgi:hypothetical protein
MAKTRRQTIKRKVADDVSSLSDSEQLKKSRNSSDISVGLEDGKFEERGARCIEKKVSKRKVSTKVKTEPTVNDDKKDTKSNTKQSKKKELLMVVKSEPTEIGIDEKVEKREPLGIIKESVNLVEKTVAKKDKKAVIKKENSHKDRMYIGAHVSISGE